MQHYQSLEDAHLQNTWLTIGTFDGVHLGHQEILSSLVNGAQEAGMLPVVLTFFPHPAFVLGKRQAPLYLTHPAARARLLAEAGVAVVITHPFSHETAAMSAEAFLQKIRHHIQFQHLVIGHDFAFGQGRTGNESFLRGRGRMDGFTLDVLQPVWVDGALVSSSRIRQALAEGEVAAARQLLGRPFALSGPVVHGDGRGALIGIPTANIDLWPEQALPATGVYACVVTAQGQRISAVANLGFRPTIVDTPPQQRLELHLLDFQQDLYGQMLEVEFHQRLRPEKRFDGIHELVTQIQQDIRQARQILET